MGVALSATLFGYLLSAAGLGRSSTMEFAESWRAAPEIFMGAFSTDTLVFEFLYPDCGICFPRFRGTRHAN